MNKKDLSERDICSKFIGPAIKRAGWDGMLQIREEIAFTKGRIIVRGKLVSRGKAKRADYILYYKPNIPIAIIEAKDNNHSVGDGTQLPSCPRLDSAAFTLKEKIALARQLLPPHWLDLLLFDLKDLPVFEYEVRDNDFLPFENASPGQQATALLSILLFQDGPPLIIDQPEDDLNMKIINEIVETLWQAKSHRQVIFTSHNANLVVNGDAELVICCDYRTTATESGGQIKFTGAIDVPEINSEIAEVMEGGVEAFKLRYQKYGF